jgi:hypothetical protein
MPEASNNTTTPDDTELLCSATIRMVAVLPHPGMLPSGPSIASPECSRRHVSLSIDYAGPSACGVTQTGFPVRSASLLSRPDLALPKSRRAAHPPGLSHRPDEVLRPGQPLRLPDLRCSGLPGL